MAHRVSNQILDIYKTEQIKDKRMEENNKQNIQTKKRNIVTMDKFKVTGTLQVVHIQK